MRWIVDAMNVIGIRPDGWWKNRRRAMADLVANLERWASAEGQQVTVVFERPISPPIRSSAIDIGHAPEAGANSGDDEIVRRVQADAKPQEITVVTSDRALADRVRQAGASVHAAGASGTSLTRHREIRILTACFMPTQTTPIRASSNCLGVTQYHEQ